jgi:hypothetical protein
VATATTSSATNAAARKIRLKNILVIGIGKEYADSRPFSMILLPPINYFEKVKTRCSSLSVL